MPLNTVMPPSVKTCCCFVQTLQVAYREETTKMPTCVSVCHFQNKTDHMWLQTK